MISKHSYFLTHKINLAFGPSCTHIYYINFLIEAYQRYYILDYLYIYLIGSPRLLIIS